MIHSTSLRFSRLKIVFREWKLNLVSIFSTGVGEAFEFLVLSLFFRKQKTEIERFRIDFDLNSVARAIWSQLGGDLTLDVSVMMQKKSH